MHTCLFPVALLQKIDNIPDVKVVFVHLDLKIAYFNMNSGCYRL